MEFFTVVIKPSTIASTSLRSIPVLFEISVTISAFVIYLKNLVSFFKRAANILLILHFQRVQQAFLVSARSDYFRGMKEIVKSDAVPQPIGPYSAAVKAGGMVFTSGQIAIDPTTQQYLPQSVDVETRMVMGHLQNLLSAAGTGFEHVVKTSIFLADMGDFPVVNEVYASFFSDEFPARETVQVAMLPKGARVEISMIACITS